MTKIRSTNILGVKHKVKYTDTGDALGYYCANERIIEINKTITDESEFIETLIHEELHGVLYLAGISQDISLPQEHCIIDSIITHLRACYDIERKKR